MQPAVSPGKVHFSVRIDSVGGGHGQISSDIDTQSLQLSSEELASDGSPATFTLTREAGSFACDGWISTGKGGGNFRFSPSAEYLANMHSRGHRTLSGYERVGAALLNITVAYVDN